MTEYNCKECGNLIMGNLCITTDDETYCSSCITELLKRGEEDKKELTKEIRTREKVIDMLNSI